jgi:leucyl/phenylalanyl-tRNA---protein transferase
LLRLTPELLLAAYARGRFPMAGDRDDPNIHWIEPLRRGVLPLESFHVPRSLRKLLRKRPFELKVDAAFAAVINACAESTPDRPRTWLNDALIDLYTLLHRRGHAHSVETWRDGRLVGGLYGLKLGGAFFGESMFSRDRDASKVALVELVGRLRAGGFRLLDTQFVTEHLTRFGTVEITRGEYRRRLAAALSVHAIFPTQPQPFYLGLLPGPEGDGGGVPPGDGGAGSGSGSAQPTTQTS